MTATDCLLRMLLPRGRRRRAAKMSAAVPGRVLSTLASGEFPQEGRAKHMPSVTMLITGPSSNSVVSITVRGTETIENP